MADDGFENIRDLIYPLPEGWNDAATEIVGSQLSSGRNSPLSSVSGDELNPTAREADRQPPAGPNHDHQPAAGPPGGPDLWMINGGEPIKYPVSGSADLNQNIPPISEDDLKNKFRIQRTYKVESGLINRTIYYCAAGEYCCGVRIRRDEIDGRSYFYSDGRHLDHSPHHRRTTYGLRLRQKGLVEEMFNEEGSRVTVDAIFREMERRRMELPDYAQVKNYLCSLKRKARNPRGEQVTVQVSVETQTD